jgi:hypothetical protein
VRQYNRSRLRHAAAARAPPRAPRCRGRCTRFTQRHGCDRARPARPCAARRHGARAHGPAARTVDSTVVPLWPTAERIMDIVGPSYASLNSSKPPPACVQDLGSAGAARQARGAASGKGAWGQGARASGREKAYVRACAARGAPLAARTPPPCCTTSPSPRTGRAPQRPGAWRGSARVSYGECTRGRARRKRSRAARKRRRTSRMTPITSITGPSTDAVHTQHCTCAAWRA